jgi:hypothetical protein
VLDTLDPLVAVTVMFVVPAGVGVTVTGGGGVVLFDPPPPQAGDRIINVSKATV